MVSDPRDRGKNVPLGLYVRTRPAGVNALRCGRIRCGWGPGTLRAGPGSAGCGSTESRCLLSARAPSGSHLPDRPERSLVAARALSLAASGGVPVRHSVPDPAAPRRVCGRSPGRGVRWWTPPNLPAPRRRLSTAVRPARFPSMPRSGRRRRGAYVGGRTGDLRRADPGDHSLGRRNTVRPPTTVRRQTGSSRPGVRSGRPGVPERGSVDQRATRSSGAWTTSSSVRQTA